MRLIALLALAVSAVAQPAPVFQARDIRPQGSADPRPLLPGMGVWIFGEHLGPPCGVDNMMDPRTYKTELCGVQVLFDGIPAKLLFTSPAQINLIAPDHQWQDELVSVQVIRDATQSAVVPVRFGVNRPVLSFDEPAFTGMPVWVHVELPWGKGFLRYPHYTEPWDLAPGLFEVRFEGRELPYLSCLPFRPVIGFPMMVGLPAEPRQDLLSRAPLHLQFAFDKPGIYEVRYTDTVSGGREGHMREPSAWTPIEVNPSTLSQRRAYFAKLLAAQPKDTTELLANFLPSLLATRDEAALRVIAPYLDSPDPVLNRYASYALNYFDPALLARVLPGRQPLRGGVR
jgi:hypothetical protein